MTVPFLAGVIVGLCLAFGFAVLVLGALCNASWLILDVEAQHMDDYSGDIFR